MKKLKTDSTKFLLIGIGNCGRGDDGLGWSFADYIKEYFNDLFDVEYRYQLQVEDAELISKYDTVIFADASHEKLKDGFELKPCKAAAHYYFSSHMQSPETILFLSRKLFAGSPEAFSMAVSGLEWELKTSLHDEAENNLASAIDYFENNFLSAHLNKAVAPGNN
jgi:hydrogenase maturation protease